MSRRSRLRRMSQPKPKKRRSEYPPWAVDGDRVPWQVVLARGKHLHRPSVDNDTLAPARYIDPERPC